VGVTLLLTTLPGRLTGQISPGPLARPHAALEGSLQCAQCHGNRKEALPGQCVACHREIGWLLSQRRGLHAREGRTACASCHPDHAGADFALVSWTADSLRAFDHLRTGWALEGAHGQVACARCHRTEFRLGEAARRLPGPQPSPGWVGLERECTACHIDVHRGALDRNCVACHDMAGWKPAPRFDHARSQYPLTGAHVQVPCAKCHLDPHLPLKADSAGRPLSLFKPVPHQQCSTCHTDPHAGKFGAVCSECHQTRSFTVIEGASFNHSRTRYPLAGKHASITCTACHEPGGVKRKDPAFGSCGACHTDAHAGTATLAGKPADCASCHTVAGFAPASFTVAQHQAARYPLEGRHQQVACAGCHTHPQGARFAALGKAGVQLRPAAARCTDCHQQDHGTQLAGRSDGGACSTCHTVAGWKPSSFSIEAHGQLRLPLEGKHAAIACAACHGPDRKGLAPVPAGPTVGRARVLLAIADLSCTSCHADPHGGQLKAQKAGGATGGCAACHDTGHFRPSSIDVAAHRNYGFVLEGGHAATPCTSCHESLGRPRPAATLVGNRSVLAPWLFPVKGTSCTACHATPHGAQFDERADRGRCDACHDTDGFRPASRFNHDKDTSFPLSGGHAGVACDRCHKPEAALPGSGLRYRGVSPKCESCHAGGTPARRRS
jgi:hypothetical protein